MNSIGILGLFSGALQLTIPSYGLRLIRRFGVQRVGWFLVLAFASLALLHLVIPLHHVGLSNSTSWARDAVYAIGSVLLLIGMAHSETVASERVQASRQKEIIESKCQVQANQRTADLVSENKALLNAIALREQREEELTASEAQYKFLFFENPQPMWIFDLRSLRFLGVNKSALSQYGFTEPEFFELGVEGLVAAEAAERFVKSIAKPCFGAELRGYWPIRRRDGTVIEVEITGFDMKFGDCPARLVLARDVSPQQKREHEFVEQVKSETIIKVAAGVGRHFTDIVGAVTGQVNMLLDKTNAHAPDWHLNQISDAAQRGAALTRQLMAAAGQQPLSLELLSVNYVLEQSTPMLRRLLGKSINLEQCLARSLPPIAADAHKLETMIVNLVLNARDAMPTGGILTLSTTACRITEAERLGDPGVRSGEFVCLSVRDTGCGMTLEVRSRLFEPFFTTKESGKATGLGLASLQGMVKQHTGWVQCRSEVGAGTEFKIFFPCASGQASASKVIAKPKPASNRKVLLVEPNDQLRTLARFVLDGRGFCVVEADCASVARTLWQAHHGTIDLLFTDIDLPEGSSGIDLAQRLQRAKPALKVIYARNCAGEGETQRPPTPEAQPVIGKPYTAQQFIETIEKTMEQAE